MPEPATILLGGVALMLALALVSFSRFTRLRRHIHESATAVAVERRRRDRLVTALRQSRSAPGDSSAQGSGAGDEALAPGRLTEEVEEAEDRLTAVNRLHTAQVRAWNRLGRSSPWGRLRRLTGWRPMPEPPAEYTREATVKDDERA